jgi:hypothetical protein
MKRGKGRSAKRNGPLDLGFGMGFRMDAEGGMSRIWLFGNCGMGGNKCIATIKAFYACAKELIKLNTTNTLFNG